MLGLAVRQADIGRHRCAVCAYDTGLRIGLNDKFDRFDDFISTFADNELYKCKEGFFSPNSIISQIPVSQSGIENKVLISRHKCVTCALNEGFNDGLKKRKQINADFELIEVPPPSTEEFEDKSFSAQKSSYKWTEDKDKAQRIVGMLGEQAVLQHETEYLKNEGLWQKDDCEPRWVSNLDGDQMGYDVLSYFERKREKWIEVKTTSGPATTPFHISANQLACGEANPEKFELYRLYNFNLEGGEIEFYKLKGNIADLLHLAPTSFRAKPK